MWIAGAGVIHGVVTATGGVVLGGRRDERGRYMLSVYTNMLGQSVGVLGEECGEGGAYVQYCVV